MKTLTMTVAALALLGAPAAFAQQGGQGGQGGQWQGHQGGQGNQGRQGGQWQGRQAGQPAQGVQGRQAGGQPGAQGQRPNWNAYLRNNPDLQRAYRQNQQNPNYHESPGAFAQRHYQEHGRTEGRSLPMQPYQPSNRQGEWRNGRWQGRGGEPQNRGDQGQWRRRDEQGRWQGRGERDRWQDYRRDQRFRNYQRNFQAQRRFRMGTYYWPRGWAYRRFSYGMFLPQIFFSQNYWIYDYANYGLPYAPPGTVWVRYGPDALLIDEDTGEIIQVVYGMFY